jgi:putative component of membrane protein insertase Oxa1/YidC/SpoIIIJ protein YidD
VSPVIGGWNWVYKILPCPPFSKEGAAPPPLKKGDGGGFDIIIFIQFITRY